MMDFVTREKLCFTGAKSQNGVKNHVSKSVIWKNAANNN